MGLIKLFLSPGSESADAVYLDVRSALRVVGEVSRCCRGWT